MDNLIIQTITIPKKIAQKGDLVVISRKEYDALMAFTKMQEFIPTAAQKKALSQAERNFLRGRTLSYHEFTKQLGLAD